MVGEDGDGSDRRSGLVSTLALPDATETSQPGFVKSKSSELRIQGLQLLVFDYLATSGIQSRTRCPQRSKCQANMWLDMPLATSCENSPDVMNV